MTSRSLAIALALFPGCAPSEPPAAPLAPGKPLRPPVEADLLASVAALAPGSAFEIGVRLRIAPGWHVYWLNPGESGLRTRVAFRAPAGFTVSEPRFPGPRRFQALGATSFGYEGETLVMARVEASSKAAGEARFEADASWLACKDVCMPGKASLALALPAAGEADAALFDRHRARLPRPLGELMGAELSRAGTGDAPALVLHVPGAEKLDFFPAPSEWLELASLEQRPSGQGLTLTAAFRRLAGAGGGREPGGVLLWTRGSETVYYDVSTP